MSAFVENKLIKCTNGDVVYTGTVNSKGQRHGSGKWEGISGDVKGHSYEGEFKDDSKHGTGTYVYANGSKYVGEYKNNKIHGQGRFFVAEENNKK